MAFWVRMDNKKMKLLTNLLNRTLGIGFIKNTITYDIEIWRCFPQTS
jgi:hypothetical protein